MTTQSDSEAAPHVYRWRERPVILIGGVLLLLVTGFGTLITLFAPGPAIEWTLLIEFALGFIVGGFWLAVGLITRIETSPAGIVYYGPGPYVLRSGWENAESIRQMQF